MDTNAQKESASKPLELEGPSKEDSEEMPQPTLKDNIPKDWQFKKHILKISLSVTLQKG